MQSADGACVITPDRPPIQDLDALPILDRTGQDSRSASVLMGRGCPYRCAFCADGATLLNPVRLRSPERVLEEVDHLLHACKVRYLIFQDGTFVARPGYARRIIDGLRLRREQGLDFAWFCEARADILARDPGLLEAMAEAGLARLQIGIESGDPKVLEAYRKGVTPAQIRDAVQAAAAAGIPSIIGNFIVGGAFEDPGTLERSMTLADDLADLAPGRLDLSTAFLTPYPGTAIAEDPARFGLVPIDPQGLTGDAYAYPFFTTRALDKWEILDAKARFETRIRSRREAILASGRVPARLLSTHVRLYRDYGIGTLWRADCMRHPWFRRHVELLEGGCTGLDDLDPAEIDGCLPIRTYPIGTSRHGHLILRTFDKVFELGPPETALLERCSGKSTFGEILSSLYGDVAGMRAQVLDFLRALEARHLLVWRRP